MRKNRQLAGNAVAHGLPWEAGLAALTANPADIFGIGAERGRIEKGKVADLVLWSGDPLEVTTVAEQVWIAGNPVTMRSRQTELRDRYLERLKSQDKPDSDAALDGTTPVARAYHSPRAIWATIRCALTLADLVHALAKAYKGLASRRGSTCGDKGDVTRPGNRGLVAGVACAWRMHGASRGLAD